MNLTNVPRLLFSLSTAIALSTLLPSATHALTLSRTLYNFTGDTAAGTITLEDLDGGGVKITTNITTPTVGGDIAGIWFGFNDDSLVNSLSKSLISNFTTNTGEDSFKLYTSTTDCPAFGQNNLNGGDSPCESDLLNSLISVGKAGSSGGLVQSVSFVINSVSVSDFNDAFGLRYQSTGGNEGSSKLGYYYPGYMGTTSSVFYLDEGAAVPEGAVPVEQY